MQKDEEGNAVHYTCSDEDTDPNDPRGQCEISDRIALSFFNGLLVTISYSLSRNTSNHEYIL